MTDTALILFDLNGLLYRYDRQVRVARLGALAGQPAAAIQAAIWDSGFEDCGDAGTLDEAAYLSGFGTRIGYPLTEAEWVAAQQPALTPIPEALGLVSRLRPGISAAVLTNNNLLIRRYFATLYPEIAALVGDRSFVSAEFGARKPDPAVYLRCAARLGVDPAAILFVDDSAANVEGASAAGLAGYHFTDPEHLESELCRRGLLVSAS